MIVTRTHLIALTTLATLGLCAARPAAAQQYDSFGSAYYSTDGTYTLDSNVSGSVLVGKDIDGNTSDPTTLQPYNPTLNIMSGGSTTYGLYTYNASVVNINGGTVNEGVVTRDTSTVSLNSGTAAQFSAIDSSTVMVTGGTVTGTLDTEDTSTADITGGNVSDLDVEGYSDAYISGGTFGYVGGHGDGGSSQVVISGGTFGSTDGVNFYDIENSYTGFVFVGSDLSATDEGSSFAGEDYKLSGTLEDGSSIDGDILEVDNGGYYAFVNAPAAPEPSGFVGLGLGLLGLGALGVKARKRSTCS